MPYTKNGDFMNLQSFYVKYEYPMTGDIQIDNEIKLNIDNKVNHFYNEVELGLPNDLEYSLEITYDKKEYQNYITYILYTTVYLGGAHPNTNIETFTYENGKRIEIMDIVNQEQLHSISHYVKEELLQHPGSVSDMIEEGTIPDHQNYRNFYYTEKGITFLFEQYQVAPYSSGIIEVVVPHSILNF